MSSTGVAVELAVRNDGSRQAGEPPSVRCGSSRPRCAACTGADNRLPSPFSPHLWLRRRLLLLLLLLLQCGGKHAAAAGWQAAGQPQVLRLLRVLRQLPLQLVHLRMTRARPAATLGSTVGRSRYVGPCKHRLQGATSTSAGCRHSPSHRREASAAAKRSLALQRHGGLPCGRGWCYISHTYPLL